MAERCEARIQPQCIDHVVIPNDLHFQRLGRRDGSRVMGLKDTATAAWRGSVDFTEDLRLSIYGPRQRLVATLRAQLVVRQNLVKVQSHAIIE